MAKYGSRLIGKGPVAYGLLSLVVNILVATALSSAAAGADPGQPGPVRLLALGDSLTAGFNLPQGAGFTVRLEAALKAEKLAIEVINAGISGDTTAGGLARLDWALAARPDGVILELGANDALRGLEPERVYNNLDQILTRLDRAGIPVLLAGMLAPPNLGADYGRAFAAVYRRLADRHRVVFYPFFLDGVAADPTLNQGDGLHPTERGVEVIVRKIQPFVKKLIEQVRSKHN
ncbi:MAG: arylesterase [Alphaproteobacteria bacterium]|nr:arylesterase [Alphaproteobacteria bacterium]